MARRKNLYQTLAAIATNVYYQPPENIKLKYPCIIYSLANISKRHADSYAPGYTTTEKYNITVIDRDPDSVIVDNVLMLPYCSFVNQFAKENLYHTNFTIYV